MGKPAVSKNHTHLRPWALWRFGERCASAKAPVGYPPVGEIRRSMVDLSLEGFLPGVTHSSTAKAVVSYVGG